MPPKWTSGTDSVPDSDFAPGTAPQQAGFLSSSNLPLLLGSLGLFAGGLLFLTNRE